MENKHLQKSEKNFKLLKTTNLQLSQKSFKACLRKLIIIAPFIHRNNLSFYFKKLGKKSKKQKKSKKEEKKYDNFYFFIFRNCSKKGVKGDTVYIVNALKVFLKRMKQ